MIKIIRLLFLFVFCNGFSQQSNKVSEKEFEDLREKTEMLTRIYPDSASTYALLIMKLAEATKSKEKIAKALSTMAYAKSSQNLEDEAMKLNQKSFLINNDLKNHVEIAKNYIIFGGIYQNKSDYIKATDYYLKSLEISKKENIPSISIRSLRELSTININQGNSKQALKYAMEALKVAKKHPDDREKAKCFVNIGGSYQLLGKIDSTKKYYQDAYNLFLKIKDKNSVAWILTGLSNVYYADDQEKALGMMIEAENIYKVISPNNPVRISNLGNIASVYFNFAQHFTENHNFTNKSIPNSKEKLLIAAEKHYLEAIKLSSKIPNNLYFIKENLANLQSYTGDYKNAYNNLIESKKIGDSLFSQENKNAIAKLESEKEVSELKATNEKKATLNKILIGSSFALLILGFLGYINFRNKQKLQSLKITELEKDKQLLAIDAMLKGQEEERSRIAKDLHDGLGGLLSGTKLSFTNMRENLILTPENALQFQKSLNMLDSTITDLRKVAHNLMPEALVKFGLDEALRDFCNSIQSATTIKVDYQKLGVERKINPTTETFIYRIIQELINNAVKHAQAKEILVQLAFTDTKIVITVEDNGKGYDANNVKNQKGDGLNNIEYRVQYLNGTIDTVTSPNNGTAVNIELNA